MQSQADKCFDSIQQIGRDNYRRARSANPNQRFNTGRRVITARQLVAEFEEAYARAQLSQSISRQLYDNILTDLRNGRTTESVRLAALGDTKTQPRRETFPRPQLDPLPQPVPQPGALNETAPATEPATERSPAPRTAGPLEADREFDDLMEVFERGLLGTA